MSNEVINQNDAEFERKLRAMAGQYVGGSDNYIPKLMINKAPEDKDGKEVPVGGFVLSTKAHGRVYAPRKGQIKFRLYAKRYGYAKFDSSVDVGGGRKGATTARSVQLSDFKRGSEYISDDGTMKCGKASIPEGVKNPKVTTKIFLYGTVSFKGVTADGVEVELVNEPALINIQGRSFMEVDGYLKDFGKDQRRFFDYEMTLTPVYTSNADGGFYNTKMEFTDLTNRLDFTDEVFETLKTFCEYIEAGNKVIEAKFNQAIASKDAGPDENDEIVEGGDLADDMIEDDDEQS